MEKLLGKKVLLFSPFGTCKHYTDGCVTELESRGAEVRVSVSYTHLTLPTKLEV